MEYLIDDCAVTAKPISFEDYKDKFIIISNEFHDDEMGYEVTFLNGQIIFIPESIFSLIAQPSDY